ncbi:response regulator [Cellvibrio sp.]|uniref:response regulator n=1 Tax=Cellvibrio sp. TaxID=1965322 RepID=UPI00396480B3
MNILIVEDEVDLGSIVRDYLNANGFASTLVNDADSGLEKIKQESWDLIVLDVMLPSKSGRINGLALCQEVRNNTNTPVIIMSARIEETDRLIGFELGADDYICKPFSPRELVARVKAILKRANPEPCQGFQLIKESLTAMYGSNKVELTLIEYRILKTLSARPNTIISRDDLMKNAYSDHRIVSDRTMDSHITKLRKKLLPLTDKEIIHSVYGAGYKFHISDN